MDVKGRLDDILAGSNLELPILDELTGNAAYDLPLINTIDSSDNSAAEYIRAHNKLQSFISEIKMTGSNANASDRWLAYLHTPKNTEEYVACVGICRVKGGVVGYVKNRKGFLLLNCDLWRHGALSSGEIKPRLVREHHLIARSYGGSDFAAIPAEIAMSISNSTYTCGKQIDIVNWLSVLENPKEAKILGQEYSMLLSNNMRTSTKPST